MRKFVFFLLVFLFLLINGVCAAPMPEILPAVQRWDVAEGSFTISSATTVFVRDTALSDTAELFVSDVKALVGGTPARSESLEGSIILQLTEEKMPTNGYRLAVSSQNVVIEAPTVAGVFYGTQTLLQMLHSDTVLPCGVITDWADLKERASMIDIGRKYYTIGWLKNHIRRMAYYKMNFLHLHLSDNEGWRIQCDTYPAIVSSPYYTKNEMRDLIAYAKQYHVEIIPEIDMPGHMKPVVSTYPHLGLSGTNNKLDLGNPDVYTFVQNLIREYCDLFPGQYFHCGMDEYLTAAEYPSYASLTAYARQHYDTSDGQMVYYHFIRFANDIVNSYGKTMRIWNDGLYENGMSIVPKNIVVDIWLIHEGGLTAKQLIGHGFDVVNCNTSFLYYVLGVDWASPNGENFHKKWRADMFVNYDYNASAQVRGAKHQVWADQPSAESEESVNRSIREIIASFAEKTWNKNSKASYLAFTHRMLLVGDAPGWSLEPYCTEGMGIARGVPVTASHEYIPNAWTADKVTDGNTATRWSSEGTDGAPAVLTIDLGMVHKLSGMKILWEAAYATQYTIAVSENRTDWSTVRTVQNGDGGTDILNGGLGKGRYLRLTCTQSSFASSYSIYEVYLFGKPVGYNILQDATVKASAEYCTTALQGCATHVTDGNEDTRWTVESFQLADNKANLTMALDHTTKLDSVVILWENAFAAAYALSVSNDGEEWKKIYETTSGNGGTDVITGLSGEGKYIRLDLNARGTDYGYSIYEIYAYEKEANHIRSLDMGKTTCGIDVASTKDGVCILSFFDEEGRLLSAQVKKITPGEHTLAFARNENAASYAVYMWDSMDGISPHLDKMQILCRADLEKEPFLKELPPIYSMVYENDFNQATASDIHAVWTAPILNMYQTPVVNGELKAHWNIGAGETVGYTFMRSIENAYYQMKVRTANCGAQAALTLRNGDVEILSAGNMYGDFLSEAGSGLGIVVVDKNNPGMLGIMVADIGGEAFQDADYFTVKLPEEASFEDGATLTIYDLRERVLIYVNNQPTACVRLSGIADGVSDFGAVYDGSGKLLGTFQKRLYTEGHLSLTERASELYIDDVTIGILKR